MFVWLGITVIWLIIGFFLALYLKIRFIPASDIESAILVAERLEKEGSVPIINLLGEHCTNKAEVDKAVEKYISLIDAIKEKNLKAKISVKPTQIGLAISEDFYFGNLHRLARRAYNQGVPLEVDVESLKYLDATLKVFLKIPGMFNVRQAIQAYLRRSWNDVKILTLYQRKIRLVKGAYSESNLDEEERARQLLCLTEQLLKKGHEPAIATISDEKWLEFICGFSDYHQVAKNAFVIQTLYGCRDDLKYQLRDERFRVEVYVPVGLLYQALPYLWRRIKEIYKSFVS